MPTSHNRPQRVADLIQKTLAQLLLRETKDPRFALVTITAVDVSPDLANAKVFVSVLDDTKVQETVEALNKASGFLRHLLADSVELRIIPKLYFFYDESISRGDKISRLIDEALNAKKNPKSPKE